MQSTYFYLVSLRLFIDKLTIRQITPISRNYTIIKQGKFFSKKTHCNLKFSIIFNSRLIAVEIWIRNSNNHHFSFSILFWFFSLTLVVQSRSHFFVWITLFSKLTAGFSRLSHFVFDGNAFFAGR